MTGRSQDERPEFDSYHYRLMERMIREWDLENGAGAYGARQFTSATLSELASSAAQSHAGFKGDRLLVQWWKFIELRSNELKHVFPELERDVIQT